MENFKEVVASEEVKETVLEVAEEIVAEETDSILKKIAGAGIKAAGVAGALYLGYRFVAKPVMKKIAEKKQAKLEVIDCEATDVCDEEDSEE